MKILYIAPLIALIAISCSNSLQNSKTIEYVVPEKEPIDYVNPLMGTQSWFHLSHGNVYPSIALPWGMNSWTPQTGEMGNGWQYVYSDHQIRGFKQTHMPSPWMNDYGQFSIMPMTGELHIDEKDRASWFSHKSETVHPNYYRVYLGSYDITTEITPTERAAYFRFTFPETEQAYVLVDAFDEGSHIQIIPEENKILGYTTKNSGGVPDNFRNYFVIQFDKEFENIFSWNDREIYENDMEQSGDHVGAVIGFQTVMGEVVHARVASSFISFDQAELNLEEIGRDDFETVKAKGREIWNEKLGRVTIEGGELEQLRTFYTTYWRTLLFPRKFYEFDVEGKMIHYSPFNGEVLPGYLFTDTGFWDTFRAVFPFYNLMYPSINEKMQAGLVNTYRESGFLPEWASPGHRQIMIGNNSSTIVADAYLKGGGEYDIDALYEAILHGSENVHPEVSSTGRLGHEYYNEIGYVPYDVGINESAARTLEYAFADWTIWKLAKELDRPEEEIERFRKRSQNYRNMFDSEHNLMRGRNKDGSFQSPFNPFKWGDAFTEGNSWHYTWSVFHDVEGLADLMGGRDQLVTMLDSVFIMPANEFDDSYYGYTIHEIREMMVADMGQYAHGNQPIQHMIYLYNHAGEPWKAQYWVRETMDRMYSPTPDGYIGDEDNGQTSAWYVFSSLGFYPVTPGADQYVLGAPLFPKATLQLENGNKIVIKAPNNSKQNRYIDRMYLNGERYEKNWLDFNDLMNGAVIEFEMTDTPNKQRGTDKDAFPYSYSLHE